MSLFNSPFTSCIVFLISLISFLYPLWFHSDVCIFFEFICCFCALLSYLPICSWISLTCFSMSFLISLIILIILLSSETKVSYSLLSIRSFVQM
jgi:hypothetical protein